MSFILLKLLIVKIEIKPIKGYLRFRESIIMTQYLNATKK